MTIDITHSPIGAEADGSRSTVASDLGLAPGVWPWKIILVSDAESQLFYRDRQLNVHGELAGFDYVAPDGQKLTVFND
jgi:hypothetical protein